MNLHSACYYRGNSELWTDSWRDEDYRALALVKAVKQLPFRARTKFNIQGKDYFIEDSPKGRHTALSIAGAIIAAKMRRAGYENASLVPIPSSSHVDPGEMFTGRRIAEMVQLQHQTFVSAPMLYLDEVLPKSSAGGSRNSYAFQRHLLDVPDLLEGPAVLIDDVCTTGGHMKACARYLRNLGVNVQDAFVVGRTARERPDNMFSVACEQINIDL